MRHSESKPVMSVLRKDPESLSSLVAPPMMLLSGFLSFVKFHDYDGFAPEILLIAVMFAAVGLALGALLAAVRSPGLRACVFLFPILWFLDLHIFSAKRLANLVAFDGAVNWRLVIGFVGIWAGLMAVLLLRRNIGKICAVVFAAIFVSTVVLPMEKVQFGPERVPPIATEAGDLPPIIHLVLDGHIGIAGVPDDLPGGMELKQELRSFYLDHGFSLYARVYSRFFLTRDALSSLLNADSIDLPAMLMHLGNGRWSIRKNGYLAQLSRRGYRARIYQSDYLDFCSTPGVAIESCNLYSASSINWLQDLDLSVSAKADLILVSYLSNSGIYGGLFTSYNWVHQAFAGWGLDVLPSWHRQQSKFFSLDVLKVLRRLKADILAAPRGRVFFAHLLLPHRPYVFDAECRLRRDVDQWFNRDEEYGEANYFLSPEDREDAYAAYFAQTRCLTSVLDDLFQVMGRDRRLDDALVIVHGDHGSRLSLVKPVPEVSERISPQDYLDSYSTLFAIRSPDLAAEYHGGARAIQSIFAKHAFGMSPDGNDGVVYLAPSRSKILQRSKMNGFEPRGSP
jgi:hypothetical protein